MMAMAQSLARPGGGARGGGAPAPDGGGGPAPGCCGGEGPAPGGGGVQGGGGHGISEPPGPSFLINYICVD